MSRADDARRGRAAARPAARLALTVLAVAAFVVASPGSAGALETDRFGVEPYPLFVEGEVRRSFQVSLDPGGTLTDAVRLWNKTRKPVTVRLYGAGVQVADGQYSVAAYEARDAGAGGWLDPDATEVRLPPNEERIVSFTVSAPPVLPREGQTVALVAESDTGIEAEGVDVVARLAMLVDVRPEPSGLAGISWWVWLAVALIVVATGLGVWQRVRR
ncbi:MAG TPA: hypothetical protein VG709_01415, partial [Actinomycetota bacterium]|nr:hypothetical protein [Actinomycetota bacterium]